MADDRQSDGFITKIKQWISWSWKYLWGIWCLMIVVLLWTLRGPLKLKESLNFAAMFISTLTPKFYVALTGTSSFISGVILMCEWWYFRKYGTSFIEQLSVSHLAPLLGMADDPQQTQQQKSECKMWRNPMSLLRGAEYQRLKWTLGLEPLTTYDLSLSGKDHLSLFTCEADNDLARAKPGDNKVLQASKKKDVQKRLALAHEAINESTSCATAYILLAEEEATTIVEAEGLFKQALRASETCLRQHNSSSGETESDTCHRRHTNINVYVKRRLAMCARKLGRVKEAVKMMKDLLKEYPFPGGLNIHENLIEALLEMQAYSEVQQVLTKYDDISLPKSATICYTAALLKARAVADKFSPESAAKKGLSPAEMSAVEAIHRAVEFNPHVPKYLLEQKSILLPAEHILKRGDSEAIAYAFCHLTHWKRVEGALNLLHCTWEGTFRLLPYPLEKGHLFHPYPTCTEAAERELLPAYHDISVYPQKELPFFILFTAALCSFSALLALLTHQFPEPMAKSAHLIFTWLSFPFTVLLQKVEDLFPAHIWHQLTRM